MSLEQTVSRVTVHTHTHLQSYAHTHAHAYTHMDMHTHTHLYTHTDKHMHTHLYTHMDTHTHMHIYMHSHARTHALMGSGAPSNLECNLFTSHPLSFVLPTLPSSASGPGLCPITTLMCTLFPGLACFNCSVLGHSPHPLETCFCF